MNNLDRQSMSIREVCALAKVSRRTVYNWMSLKKIEWVRTAGGSVRIFTDTVLVNDPQSPRLQSTSSDTLLGIRIEEIHDLASNS